MISLVGAMLCGMGLFSVLTRRTILGVLIGLQLLVLGATLSLVLTGISSGMRLSGHIFALMVCLGAVAQLVGGYSLAIRRFFLKNEVKIEELRSLKK